MSAFDLGAVSTFRDLRVDKAQALKPLEEAAEVFGAYQNMMTCAETYVAVVDDVDGRAREIAEGPSWATGSRWSTSAQTSARPSSISSPRCAWTATSGRPR